MNQPWQRVEHGFVILRSNGSVVDGHLYTNKLDAQFIVAFLNGCSVAPARRVHRLRRQSSTTATLRTEIIVDRGAA